MPDWYRVRDKATGHEYNSPFLADGLEEVKEGKDPAPTHDVYGNPIPPKLAEQKAASKETAK